MVRGQGFRGGITKGRGRAGPARPNSRPTHFLCLPLVSSTTRLQLETALRVFGENAAQRNDGFTQKLTSAVRPVGTLHLTLGVMTLEPISRYEAAVALLSSLNPREFLRTLETSAALGQENLVVSLESLTSMHNPTDTSILYAEPRDSTSRIQAFAEHVLAVFKEKGFITETRPLKLHATLLNTIYAGKDASGRKFRFDASKLIEQYESFVWATNVAIERISICKMGAKKEYDGRGNVVGEKYEEVASIDI